MSSVKGDASSASGSFTISNCVLLKLVQEFLGGGVYSGVTHITTLSIKTRKKSGDGDLTID